MTENPPTSLVARSPEDVLAMVPIVIGFAPSESVVMLTFGAHHTFHARIDLPTRPAEIDEMVTALLDPARRHRVRRVVLVIYADDTPPSRRAWRALRRRFEGAGIDVLEGLRVHGGRWYPLLGGDARSRTSGVAFDISGHRFAAQAVVDGRVTHASRDELAALLDADPGGVAAVARLVESQPAPAAGAAEERWVDALVRRHAAEGTRVPDADVARLLRALGDPRLLAAAWTSLTRQDAQRHVDLWRDVLRRTPPAHVPPVAALLGLAAWQGGQGALAWCAVDRCAEVDAAHPLAAYLTSVLSQAVPPGEWRPDTRWGGLSA